MSKRSKARWKRPGGKFRQAYTAIGGECPSCLGVFPIERMTRDHVIPRRHGGATDWDNIQLLCNRCNLRKGGMLCAVGRAS